MNKIQSSLNFMLIFSYKFEDFQEFYWQFSNFSFAELFVIDRDTNLDLANFVQTNRGGRKLLIDGYSFTVNRKLNENLISWKCTKYKQFGCRARAVTRVIEGTEFVKLSKPDHSHTADMKIGRDEKWIQKQIQTNEFSKKIKKVFENILQTNFDSFEIYSKK